MRDRLLIRALWHVVPVIVAGLGHVAALKLDVLPRLAAPIDRGATWHGVPVFGTNKTWRGVLFMGALTSIATAVTRAAGSRLAPGSAPADCDTANSWILGAATGLVYCASELPNSFLKRRLGIPPGGRASRLAWLQYAADMADSVVGCVVVLRLMCRLRWREGVVVGLLGLGAHIGVDRLMWLLGLRGSERGC